MGETQCGTGRLARHATPARLGPDREAQRGAAPIGPHMDAGDPVENRSLVDGEHAEAEPAPIRNITRKFVGYPPGGPHPPEHLSEHQRIRFQPYQIG